AGRTFDLCEPVPEYHCCESDRKRRNHTADHGCCNRFRIACGKCGNAECIGSFVDGSPHIDCHHASDNRSKENDIAAAHVAECRVHPVIQCCGRRVDDVVHDDTGQEYTHKWI